MAASVFTLAALADGPHVRWAELRCTDRQKIALLLQGAVALRIASEADASLGGWRAAGVDRQGGLCGLELHPGPDPSLPQEVLRALLGQLFGGLPVVGRGEGRRAARELAGQWEQSLTPVPPRRAVEQILTAAPFLFEPEFTELLARLPGVPQAGAPGGRGWAQAQAAFHRGQANLALAALEGLAGGEAEALRLVCRLQRGEREAVRRRLLALARQPDELFSSAAWVALADLAVRVLSPPAAGREHPWVRRAHRVAGQDPELRLRAHLVAAGAAWDHQDLARLDEQLAAAAPFVAVAAPRQRSDWHRTRALRAMLTADGEAIVGETRAALAVARRELDRARAAGLWNDLGIGRVRAGDLPGAERAFGHAQRLHAGCDGPLQTTLALFNLAEVRLRRGRTTGVVEILTRSMQENRHAGNTRGLVQDLALAARLELVVGRPEAALARVEEALEALAAAGLDWHRGELQLFRARALGWLERPGEARAALAAVPPAAFAELEPEEVPAVWALAGEPENARRAAQGTVFEVVWSSVLAGDTPRLDDWAPVATLEPYRAARWVFDAETLSPGAVPAELRQRAAGTLRRLGASAFAERLERRAYGPWGALAHYLTAERPGLAAFAHLLDAAGYPAARLSVRREVGDERVLIGQAGGDAELAAPWEEGHLVLAAPQLDVTLAALFALALRDLRGTESEEREPAPAPLGGLIGEAPALRAAVDRAGRLAGVDVPVLVLGESGTGKELVARHVHRLSPRARRPFVAINCAAVAESLLLSDLFGHVRGAFTGADRDRAGVFEAADGGTVFLDEIGDLPLAAQGMLLRVLQEGEVRRVGETLPRRVDARVVAATHRDLAAMVRTGSFRQDLFYRLKVAQVVLPPLRDRGRDVLLLAEALLPRWGGGRLTAAARVALERHPWPGNVRELENVLKVAVALAGPGAEIGPELLDLPTTTPSRGEGSYAAQVDALRRRLVAEALAATGGQRAEAARRLGLSRQALSYLVRELRLE